MSSQTPTPKARDRYGPHQEGNVPEIAARVGDLENTVEKLHRIVREDLRREDDLLLKLEQQLDDMAAIKPSVVHADDGRELLNEVLAEPRGNDSYSPPRSPPRGGNLEVVPLIGGATFLGSFALAAVLLFQGEGLPFPGLFALSFFHLVGAFVMTDHRGLHRLVSWIRPSRGND